MDQLRCAFNPVVLDRLARGVVKSLIVPSHAGHTGTPIETSEWAALDPLLDEWQQRVHDSQFLHYECANYYAKLHYGVGIPAVVLASIVGTTIFATLSKDVTLWARFAVGFISTIAAVLSGL